MPLTRESAEAIERLRAYKPPKIPWDTLDLSRRAAVLILLYADSNGRLRVVLTERSNNLSSFAGEVALPGGKADHINESPLETARREAEEEIGLPSKPSNLPSPFILTDLCEMPLNLSRNSLCVRPCISFLSSSINTNSTTTSSTENKTTINTEESLIPRLDPKEVQSVFTAPFEAFLQHDYNPPELSEIESKDDETIDEESSIPWYTGFWVDWPTRGKRWKIHEFQVPAKPIVSQNRHKLNLENESKNSSTTRNDSKIIRYRVWGMTARILIDAARLAYGREPTFDCVPGFGDDDSIVQLRDLGQLGPRKKEKVIYEKTMKEIEITSKTATIKDGVIYEKSKDLNSTGVKGREGKL